mgnify:CR=1 FL=1
MAYYSTIGPITVLVFFMTASRTSISHILKAVILILRSTVLKVATNETSTLH